MEFKGEGAGPGRGDAKLSGSEVGEGDRAEDGGGLAELAVKARWGVCRFLYTIIATLESKVENEFLTLI